MSRMSDTARYPTRGARGMHARLAIATRNEARAYRPASLAMLLPPCIGRCADNMWRGESILRDSCTRSKRTENSIQNPKGRNHIWNIRDHFIQGFRRKEAGHKEHVKSCRPSFYVKSLNE